MTPDLDNPAGVEALREAAVMARDEPATLERMACAARGFLSAGTKTLVIQFAAALTLTDPTRAADLLRRLLERSGLSVGDGHYDLAEVDIYVANCAEQPGSPIVARVLAWIAVEDEPRILDVPCIILALLDATDRDTALAALRGDR